MRVNEPGKQEHATCVCGKDLARVIIVTEEGRVDACVRCATGAPVAFETELEKECVL